MRQINKNMKVLVTGSSGFLGSIFLDFLKKRDIPYLIYDRNNPEEFTSGFDSVVNFGGLTPNSSVENMIISSEEYYVANVGGTELLLKNISENENLKKFINIGTAAEYGFKDTPIVEEVEEKPEGHYSKSKLEQSRIVEKFSKESGVKTINLRLFNVAGLPNGGKNKERATNNPFIFEKLISQFVDNFNGRITINNKNDVRDYVDIEDINEAILSAIKTDKGESYEIINICSGVGTKLIDVVDLFGKALDKEYEVFSVNSGGASISIGVNNKAKKILNWEPKVSLEESIKKMIWQKTEL